MTSPVSSGLFPFVPKMKPAPTLIAWRLALEVQTPRHLKCFVTNIGELASLQIQQWCTQKGILHLLVAAPYTSPPTMVGLLNDSTAPSWTKLAPCNVLRLQKR